jgi:hypothetical protein
MAIEKIKMTNRKKKVFVNNMKRHQINIFKRSQQFYLISKQKLNENGTTLEREKKIQSSITRKAYTKGQN